MSKKYTLSIYDTISGKFVDVAVTKELYDVYRRMTWKMANCWGLLRIWMVFPSAESPQEPL
jgi:hypothetical protein